MDGKGAWRDNVFVERLWRSVKYEEVCGPTKASATPELRSAATWTFIMADVHTRALTASHQIKPTSRRCPSAWQPNPGRGSTYRRGKAVQTTGATSISELWTFKQPIANGAENHQSRRETRLTI